MKTKFSIKEYSALAGTFLATINNSDAHAVYTDVVPDNIVEIELTDSLFVDLDNNSIDDFAFFKTTSAHWSVSSYSSYSWFQQDQRIHALACVEENGIVASLHTYNSYSWLVMEVLLDGELVNEVDYFKNGQIMASRARLFSSTSSIGLGPWVGDGVWENIPEFPDRYLGVKFVDENDCTYYGWIRCAVVDTCGKLIIKDWAYENKCGVGISAGDKIGDTSVNIIDEELKGINIYSFEKNIFIESVDELQIKIFTVNNQLVYSNIIQNKNIIIPFSSISSGVYIVEVQNEKGKMVKKVLVN